MDWILIVIGMAGVALWLWINDSQIERRRKELCDKLDAIIANQEKAITRSECDRFVETGRDARMSAAGCRMRLATVRL